MKQPPKYIERLLEWYCDPYLLEGIRGDLGELYQENLSSKGAFTARWYFTIQALGFLRYRFKRKRQHSNFEAMFKNYFTITIRNLTKHSFYSFINIFGLAVGMAAGFMILQYVYYELTYDQFFENKENIYRVQTNRYNKGELTTQWASGCAGVGNHMYQDFPEVEAYVLMRRSGATISQDLDYFEVEYPFYAEANFFEVFSIPLISGVDSLVLKDPFTVVLSETLAKKMFGDKDPIGQVVTQNDSREFTVTGVFQDLTEHSHMAVDLLYSYESLIILYGEDGEATRNAWQWDGFYNYVVLRDGTDPKAFAGKFPDWITQRAGEELERYDAGMEFILQPLTKIHLISNYRGEIKATGNERTVYFLLIIGMFVLFIAWINYINLTTARSMSRAREVGIRKVMGSIKSQLVRQFMFESFFLNLIAFAFAAVFVIAAFPFFSDFVGRSQSYTWPNAPFFWIGLAAVFLTGILLSGFYPAVVLSSFKPVSVLKGQFKSSASGNLLRKGLVSFQFIASLVLITGTYVVYKQMDYLQSQDLGVKIGQTLVIETPSLNSDSIFQSKDVVFKNSLNNMSYVGGITNSTAVPGRTPGWNAGGIRLLSEGEDQANQYRVLAGDGNFLDFYGLEVIAGRGFDDGFGNEEGNVLFYEAAMKRIGFSDPKELLNQKIYFWGDTFNVVGILKNYRQESPKQAYDALIFRYFKVPNGYYSVKLNTSNMVSAMDEIRAIWNESFNNKPFEYFFLDDYYNEQYKAEVRFGSIFGLFAGLAIFVACLGLFGLSSFITSLRSKEVGVRKVLGASIQSLWVLLTSDFLKLVGIAILISVPINYYIMQNWLENFENRISMDVLVFAFPALILMIIAVVTVSYHTIVTAQLNPARTLKDE